MEDDQDSESVTAELHEMPMTPGPIPVFLRLADGYVFTLLLPRRFPEK
jgi:hypothetical protein